MLKPLSVCPSVVEEDRSGRLDLLGEFLHHELASPRRRGPVDEPVVVLGEGRPQAQDLFSPAPFLSSDMVFSFDQGMNPCTLPMGRIRDKALMKGDDPNFFEEAEGKSSREVDVAELVKPPPCYASEVVESL